MKTYLFNKLFIACILCLTHTHAKSGDLDIYSYNLYYIGDITASEYNSLPTYCRNLAQSGPPGFKPYIQNDYDQAMLIGIGGKHHFCNIFVLKQRSLKFSSRRNFYLSRIIAEAEYVIKDTTPHAPIKVLAFLEKAAALEKLNRFFPAEKAYLDAVQFGSQHELVYLELAKFYERHNNKKKAIEILAEGIKMAKNTTILVKRYKQLGGPLPLPLPETEKNFSDDTSFDARNNEPITNPNADNNSLSE